MSETPTTILETQLSEAWRREADAYEALNRARCAFIKLFHAGNVILKIDGPPSYKIAIDPMRLALVSTEVVAEMEAIELEEPGIATQADAAASRTAAGYSHLAKKAGDLADEIQRAATVHPYDWKNTGFLSASFRLHIPTAGDKYRAGYDRIFGARLGPTLENLPDGES